MTRAKANRFLSSIVSLLIVFVIILSAGTPTFAAGKKPSKYVWKEKTAPN